MNSSSEDNCTIENEPNRLLTDITSIVKSFEDNSFYTRRSTGFSDTDVITKLDNILFIADSLVPDLRLTVHNYSSTKLLESLERIQLIKRKFKHMNEVVKYQLRNNGTPNDVSYKFICSICQTDIPIDNDKWVWNSLQQHEHIEHALIQSLANKASLEDNMSLINADKTDTSISVNPTFSLNKESIILSASSTLDSLNDNFVDLQNTLVEKNEIGGKFRDLIPVVNGMDNSQVPNPDGFKFNFQVSYCDLVEKNFYPTDMAGVVSNDQISRYTIQCRSPRLLACLLCFCEIPIQSKKNIVQHMKGQKHMKRRLNTEIVKNFMVYHQEWRKQESLYQTHQIHFLPLGLRQTQCLLCSGVPVTYGKLQIHIDGDSHKSHILKLLERNSRNSHLLLPTQAMVYDCAQVKSPDNSMPGKSHVRTYDVESREVESTSENNSLTRRSFLRTKTNMDNENSDSDSDDDSPVDEKYPENDNSSGSSPMKQSPIKENLAPGTTAVQKIHTIVKSVLNPTSRNILELLENRFLPQTRFLKVVRDTVSCECCGIVIGTDVSSVKHHILSTEHLTKSEVPFEKYKFYCDVCNFHAKNESVWAGHLGHVKHKEKCANLGARRRDKLTEHECKNCQHVIFGDEISVVRHKFAYQKKTKVIKLTDDVKKFLSSRKQIDLESSTMKDEADQVLNGTGRLQLCCNALESTLSEVFGICVAHPFGSRISGLGNKDSDLDIFIDTGDMYMGTNNQDSVVQEKFVKKSAKIFRQRKREFSDVNPIPSARTPIVQVYHIPSDLDCDLSFRHGLSVENTKFLRLCMELQPVTQPLILMVKKWAQLNKLNEHITTYAFSIMVIFYLQVNGHLLPVHTLMELNSGTRYVIDGWDIADFQKPTATMVSRVTQYTGNFKDLLQNFFNFYGSFNYATDVVCPLLGHAILKSLFLTNRQGEGLPREMVTYINKLQSTSDAEFFKAHSQICIQDPFDLSHNLTKACGGIIANKLKTLCTLTAAHLKTVS